MKIRHPSVVAFHLLLVLASLLGAAGHEHLGEANHTTRLCVADHDAATERSGTPSVPLLGPSGEKHEHDCLGCFVGCQRLSLSTSQATWHPVLVAQASRVPETSRRNPLLHAGRTSRGPPAS